MLEEGYSFIYISDKYGISEKRLKYLWALYQEQGASARNVQWWMVTCVKKLYWISRKMT